MANTPRLPIQVRARTTHGKITAYEVYDVVSRETISAHPVDANNTRDSALTAARSKCAELNETKD